jgi:hypothetical protein
MRTYQVSGSNAMAYIIANDALEALQMASSFSKNKIGKDSFDRAFEMEKSRPQLNKTPTIISIKIEGRDFWMTSTPNATRELTTRELLQKIRDESKQGLLTIATMNLIDNAIEKHLGE